MTEENKATPLIRRGAIHRIAKGAAVLIGLLFILGVVFLVWAFKTGRAVEAIRQEMLTTLHDACGVDATFSTLSVDPIDRELQLTDLRMRHLDGREIIAVEEAIAQLSLLPLFYGRLQLEKVAVLAPRASIELENGKVLNLPKCLEPPEDAPSNQAVALGVSALTIERGQFDLRVDDVFKGRLADIGVSLNQGKSGGADIALGIDGGQLELGGKKLPLHRFRMLGHLGGALTDPRALLFDQLVVEIARVKVAGEGSIDLLGPVYDAKLQIEGPIDAFHDFVDGGPAVTGAVQLDVEVSGTAITPRGVGHLKLTDAAIDGIGIGDVVEVDFRADREGAELMKFESRLGEGVVVGEGRIAFDKRFTTTVKADGKHVSFGRLLDTLGLTGPWIDYDIVTAKVDLTGPLVPAPLLEGAFDAFVEDLQVYDRSYRDPDKEVIFAPGPINAKGRWAFSTKGLSFTDATLVCGVSEGTAEASIDFASDGGFSIVANLASVDWVDLGGHIAGLTFGGFGSLSGVLEGSYEDFGAVGTLEMNDIAVAGIPFGRASANLAWRDLTSLEFTNIEGRLGESSYRGTVGVVVEGDVPLSISGEIPKGRVQDVMVPFGVDAREYGDASGSLFARFDLQGPADRLTGPIDVSMEEIEILGEKAERARVVGRMEVGRIVAEAVEIDKHGARIVGRGSLDPNSGAVRANVRTQKAKLQDLDVLRAAAPKLDGALSAKLSLSGTLQGLTGTVAASLRGVKAGPKALGDGRLSGKIAGATLALKGAMLGNKVDAEGEIRLVARLPYSGKIRVTDLEVPEIIAGLAGHTDWRGTSTFVADLKGSLADWHLSGGEIALERAELRTDALTISTAAPASFTMRRGILETKRVSLTGPRTQLTVSGRLGGRLIDLRTTGRVDLGIAELVTDSIEKVGGTLTIDSAVGGTFDNLNLVGTGRVDGGYLQWRGFASRLTGVNADLTFSQSSVLIDRSEGRFAGGRLSMTGSVLLERMLPKNLSLQISVAGVRPRFTYPKFDLAGAVDGKLTADGTFEELVVAGELDVRSGRIQPKISLANLVRGGTSVAVYDPDAETVRFDIALNVRDPIRMRNDEVDAQLTGSVRLTGTNERLGLLGVATVLKGGRVALFGPEYEIQGGTIEMRDQYSFAPQYDLVVVANACDARIRANVVGTFEDLNITYSSTPEMEASDVQSCFIRGIKMRNLDQDLGAFAGSALLKLSGVDREVKKVLPIDQIDVTTEYSSRARAYEPRVVLGKNLTLLNRSIRLEYSSSLIRKDDQRAAARIRLTPRLNLEVNWEQSVFQQFGDWGLDLKQRWEW